MICNWATWCTLYSKYPYGKHFTESGMSRIKPVQWFPREELKETILFDIDGEMHERIKKYCKTNRIEVSQWAQFAVSRLINNQLW